MSNIVERLTENIVARDLRQEGAALVSKWEKTGLLGVSVMIEQRTTCPVS
jgi:hypothetical protein